MSFNIQNDKNDTLVPEHEQNQTPEIVAQDKSEQTMLQASFEPTSDKTTPAQKPALPTEKSSSESDFSVEMIDQSMSNITTGQTIDGTVISVDDKEVIVDIGVKVESSIPITEFNHEHLPQKGDIIKVYFESQDNVDGRPKVSWKRAEMETVMTKIKVVYQNNELINGKITKRIKGGMVVEIMGVEAFLPGSQIALKNIPNLDNLINREMAFLIVKFDDNINKNGLVVSRKKVLENEIATKRAKLKEFIIVGAELDGEVKNLTDYGAFVDLGGIDGLLHITDMSYARLKHPSELINIGDKVKVKVIEYDEEKGKVSLGMKQLVPHPWENIERDYQEGKQVSGKVVNIAKYGAFVELAPGVEGLIHVSEMSWTRRITNPKHICKVGDILNCIVLLVSKENQRISLGLKQMSLNPWIDIDQHYPQGTIIRRKIKNITPFGVFVEVEPDIDGLVHISDISWTRRIYHPKEVFKKGQEIETVILSIDKLTYRVSLGIKQLMEDPFINIKEKLPVNSEVVVKVAKCIPKGILVDIPYNGDIIEGFAPISHLALPLLENTEDAYEIGEELNMKIIEIEDDNRRMILSLKAWYFSREKNLLKDYQKKHMEHIKNKKLEKTETQKKHQLKKENQKETGDETPVINSTEQTLIPPAPAVEAVAEVPSTPAPEAVEPVTEVPSAPAVEVVEPVAEVPVAPAVEAVAEVPSAPALEAVEPVAEVPSTPAPEAGEPVAGDTEIADLNPEHPKRGRKKTVKIEENTDSVNEQDDLHELSEE